MARRLSFSEACARYTNRYTMDHVPTWARSRPCDSGGTETRYYAPQFASDLEWYNNTKFHGEPGHFGRRGDCFTTGQTWPLGQWLDSPYRKGSGR